MTHHHPHHHDDHDPDHLRPFGRWHNAAPADHARLTSNAARASVALALFLLVLKTVAVWQTGSVTMLGSLADTALDLTASVATLLAVRIAALPADDDHRFGHGKAEALVALLQVVLISISAIAIAYRAWDRLWSEAATTGLEYGVGVSVIAMLATLALLAYQRLVIQRTGSVAIKADHVHYQSDLLLNLAVIAALLLDQLAGWTAADPVFGFIIAAILARGAYRAALQSIDQLMDKEWPTAKKRDFYALALAHPRVEGIHDLRTRTSGGRDFAQFHIWVAPGMTVLEAHDIMDEVEDRLLDRYPGTDIIIHPDPRDEKDPLPYYPTETLGLPLDRGPLTLAPRPGPPGPADG